MALFSSAVGDVYSSSVCIFDVHLSLICCLVDCSAVLTMRLSNASMTGDGAFASFNPHRIWCISLVYAIRSIQVYCTFRGSCAYILSSASEEEEDEDDEAAHDLPLSDGAHSSLSLLSAAAAAGDCGAGLLPCASISESAGYRSVLILTCSHMLYARCSGSLYTRAATAINTASVDTGLMYPHAADQYRSSLPVRSETTP